MSEGTRPQARAPRGFQDRRARDLRAERRILEAVSRVYEAYGFEALDTPAFEYADALGKFLPDSDRPNEGVFALQDDPDGEGGGQWMALRYDHTAPLARFAAQNWTTLPKPFRRYAYGPVWRNEKPGPGRYREFIQCDADTVGSARPEADAEMVALAVRGLEAAGLASDAFVLKINNRKLLNGLMAAAGVDDPGQRLAVLRAVDKLDRLGLEGVRLLLGEGRRDESGAFTKGAGLGGAAIDTVLAFVEAGADTRGATLDRLDRTLGVTPEGVEGVQELAAIDAALRGLGIGEAQARFDPSVVRGLEYYTGPVFEAELLLDITDERGEQVRFGSVGGGGRYDDLVARMADYFALAGELRAAGVPAEVYLGSAGMKAQMKYADRRASPAAVMVGEDELRDGTVTVKDLALGRKLAEGLADNQAWRGERPGQVTVPRSDLISTVKATLA